MGKLSVIIWGLVFGLFVSTAFAQPYTERAVEQLDDLERKRAILAKKIDVAKLQTELRDLIQAGGGAIQFGAFGDLSQSALSLIKVSGLEKKPQAVFEYGSFRIIAAKNDIVLPNIKMVGVTKSYVVLKDITTGRENLLWLSFEDQSNQQPS